MWPKYALKYTPALNPHHHPKSKGTRLKKANRCQSGSHSLCWTIKIKQHFAATLWWTAIQHRQGQIRSFRLLFSQTVTALRHGRFHLSRFRLRVTAGDRTRMQQRGFFFITPSYTLCVLSVAVVPPTQPFLIKLKRIFFYFWFKSFYSSVSHSHNTDGSRADA